LENEDADVWEGTVEEEAEDERFGRVSGRCRCQIRVYSSSDNDKLIGTGTGTETEQV
jgi:hypothetical protein